MTSATAAEERPLAGQVALITGATRGIGRAIAVRLGAEGMSVLRDRAERRARQGCGGGNRGGGREGAFHFPRRWRFRGHTARGGETIPRLGAVYIVVANAGIGTVGLVVDSDPADWRAMMDVNFFGTANLIRAALPTLLA